ncbi:MAG: hypothetical protein JSW51_06995 [Gemmatimonadota bacterium]|nr:MAG: hypothetical protein JSW51_06995 [Gemmatimonadota bacterium]
MYWYLLLLQIIGTQDGIVDPDVAVLAAASLDSTRPARVTPVVVAPHIFDELAFLADTSRSETVRCLLGTDQGDSLFIDLALEPPIIHSTAKRVRFRRCPETTLAIWHNHVVDLRSRAEEACGLSPADIREAMRPQSPELMIVQVNAEQICWWSKTQIRELGMVHGLPALPDQRRRR